MILLVFAIAGIMAYLTDTDSKINVFTVGDVDITLTETNFNSSQPMANIAPGQVIQKNPAISNTGANPAYVYMKVTIPKEGFTDKNGNSITGVPMFTYSADSNWVEMPTYSKETSRKITKVYYYNSILQPNTSTSELFQTVTVANFPNFNGISAESLNIDINAYAIQSLLPAVEEGENAFVKAYETYIEDNPSAVPLEIGDRVGYSTSLNGVTLDDWRVFYVDGDYTYLILSYYLPNSAVDTENINGLAISGNYSVYTNEDRGALLDAMATKSNWDSLLTGTMNGQAINQSRSENVWAMGSPSLELWVDSWNERNPSYHLYTARTNSNMSDGYYGYYLGSVAEPNSGSDSYAWYGEEEVSSDDLYFVTGMSENIGGYWLSSADSYYESIFGVSSYGYIGADWEINSGGVAFRPILRLPTSVVKSDNRTVENVSIYVDSILVGNQNIELASGKVAQIHVAGEDRTYSSSNTSVATVDADGVITVNSSAMAGQTTTITITGARSGATRTFTIEVQ